MDGCQKKTRRSVPSRQIASLFTAVGSHIPTLATCFSAPLWRESVHPAHAQAWTHDLPWPMECEWGWPTPYTLHLSRSSTWLALFHFHPGPQEQQSSGRSHSFSPRPGMRTEAAQGPNKPQLKWENDWEINVYGLSHWDLGVVCYSSKTDRYKVLERESSDGHGSKRLPLTSSPWNWRALPMWGSLWNTCLRTERNHKFQSIPQSRQFCYHR